MPQAFSINTKFLAGAGALVAGAGGIYHLLSLQDEINALTELSKIRSLSSDDQSELDALKRRRNMLALFYSVLSGAMGAHSFGAYDRFFAKKQVASPVNVTSIHTSEDESIASSVHESVASIDGAPVSGPEFIPLMRKFLLEENDDGDAQREFRVQFLISKPNPGDSGDVRIVTRQDGTTIEVSKSQTDQVALFAKK